MVVDRPLVAVHRQVTEEEVLEGLGSSSVVDGRHSQSLPLRSPSFVWNSKIYLKNDVSQDLDSNLWRQNHLVRSQGPLVIKEPSLASSKGIKYVEGKGKVVANSMVNVTPRGEKALSPFDPEASSSGNNDHSLDVGRGERGADKVSDGNPRLDADSGLVNPWSSNPHIRLDFKEGDVVLFDDCKAVKLNEELEILNSKRLSKALVLKVFGKDLPSHMVAWEIRRLWRHFGQFHFTSLGKGWFHCSFDSEVMLEAALSGGPWFFNGYIVGMERWIADFSSSSMRGLPSPILIRMPHLPLHCWDEENVSRIASRISKPLMLDGNMFHWRRREFARVCVRVKLDEPLPLGVWVDSIAGRFFQNVDYEKISIFCFGCGMIGHVKNDCGQRSPLLDRLEVDVVRNGGGVEEGCRKEVAEGPSYGPWILVSNKNGRKVDQRFKRGKMFNKATKGVKAIEAVQVADKVAKVREEPVCLNVENIATGEGSGICLVFGNPYPNAANKFYVLNMVDAEALDEGVLEGKLEFAGLRGAKAVVSEPGEGLEVRGVDGGVLGTSKSEGELNSEVGIGGESSKVRLAKELRSLGPIKKVTRCRKLDGGGGRRREGSKAKVKEFSLTKDLLKKEIFFLQEEEDNVGWLSEDKLWVLRTKVKELNSILGRLNTWWKQRAKISQVRKPNGELTEDPKEVEKIFFRFFQDKWKEMTCYLDDWPEPSLVLDDADKDYVLLFSDAKIRSIKKIRDIIIDYCGWTGQVVNHQKSTLVIRKTVGRRRKKKIARITGIKLVEEFDYLGTKFALRRLKNDDFHFLLDKSLRLLNIWNMGKLCLFFGRDLVNLISNIRLCQDIEVDILELERTMSGKTISEMIRDEVVMMEGQLDPISWIHKLKLSSRVELFIRRLCKGAIPTADFLFKRKLATCNICPRGCGEVEDVDHVTTSCSKLLSVDSSQSNGLFTDFWHPPPPEWYKIIIDGALKSDYGAGIGGIVQDFKGRFILAFSFYGVQWDIDQLELLAFKAIKGMMKNFLLNAKGIIFEGDNKNVIHFLQNMYSKVKKIGGSIEVDDFSFLKQWNNVIFHYVGRDCNKVADYYANLAFSYNFIWDMFCESTLPSSFVYLVKKECGLMGNSH
ncbi:hypothetical protein M5K25_008358 [Dendrobium thyrsiflorum]|uniref:CCHC-type domain-containing protein n=1 Tax=Dendrobium thyrsiflorum TaxID=117978 RepID=A0ABD0V8H5_DENTH